METYAFANQKGGVGKTTVVLGLGAALAASGVSVLLIDLDPQASATRVLGVDLNEHPTVADVVLAEDRFALADVVVATPWGVDLAPAETALHGRGGAKLRFERLLRCLHGEDHPGSEDQRQLWVGGLQGVQCGPHVRDDVGLGNVGDDHAPEKR
jgi:chromosome partitioning protein